MEVPITRPVPLLPRQYREGESSLSTGFTPLQQQNSHPTAIEIVAVATDVLALTAGDPNGDTSAPVFVKVGKKMRGNHRAAGGVRSDANTQGNIGSGVKKFGPSAGYLQIFTV